MQLTFIEFEMLALLAASPGVVFSRRELLERLRGGADYREPRTIDVHVRHLREKIEQDPSNPGAHPHDPGRRLPLQIRVRLPGGIRVRIALALVAIVAGALGTAYLIVVPSLERRLVDARLSELEELAVPLADSLPGSRFEWPETVERFDVATNTRVVAFDVVSRTPPALLASPTPVPRAAGERGRSPTTRSRGAPSRRARSSAAGGLRHAGLRDVAVPIGEDVILLFRAPLADSLATVELVERRLLLATGFALALALVLGLTAAGMLANRLRRLETAAERIAGGDFDVPIVDRGDDEIGSSRTRSTACASSSRAARQRAQGVRRERVPRAADADLLARWLPRAPGGRGARRRDRARFLETMQEQVERLAKLSTDLLDLSRVDAGQLRVAAEAVDLAEIVRGLAAELEHMAAVVGPRPRGARRRPVWVLADEERVAQIGRALVVNALVHTPPGTRVRVDAGRRGDRAELTVEDDGPGIPSAQREAVFERFYRVEGREGVGQRPRPGDRARARAPHGWLGPARLGAGAHGAHPRPSRWAPGRPPAARCVFT